MFVYELSGCGFESCSSHLNSATIDTGIEVQLPDEIIEIPLPKATTDTLKLSTYKLNCWQGRGKIVFDFFNKSFEKTFTFKKNDAIVTLMLLAEQTKRNIQIRVQETSYQKFNKNKARKATT